MSRRKIFLTGYAAAVISAVLFSIKGVFAKKAYALGASPEALLGLRFGMTLPVFVWIAWKSREGAALSGLTRADWTRVGFTAALGYVLASAMDFQGLQYISVGLERVILYLHPTMMLVLAAWLGRRRVRGPVIPALLLSYAGLALCFAGEMHAENWGATLRGSAWVFGAAAAYAVFMLGAEDLIPRVGIHRMTALGMVLSGVVFGLHAGLSEGAALFRLPAGVYAWTLAMAVFSTVLPVYLFGVGLKAMGAARSSIASMAGPVATLPLAAWLLGEPAGPLQWGGFALTLGGGAMLLLKRK